MVHVRLSLGTFFFFSFFLFFFFLFFIKKTAPPSVRLGLLARPPATGAHSVLIVAAVIRNRKALPGIVEGSTIRGRMVEGSTIRHRIVRHRMVEGSTIARLALRYMPASLRYMPNTLRYATCPICHRSWLLATSATGATELTSFQL